MPVTNASLCMMPPTTNATFCMMPPTTNANEDNGAVTKPCDVLQKQ